MKWSTGKIAFCCSCFWVDTGGFIGIKTNRLSEEIAFPSPSELPQMPTKANTSEKQLLTNTKVLDYFALGGKSYHHDDQLYHLLDY